MHAVRTSTSARSFASAALVLCMSCLLAIASPALASPDNPPPARPGQKLPPPLPETAPADYPRDASLGVIREWLKAKQLEFAKAKAPKGDDVVRVHVVAMLLPESEWLRLVERTATDLTSKDDVKVLDALNLARELEQTSFQAPSLRGPLGAKVFPAAAARLPDLKPEEAKQLPFILSRLARFADPTVSIPVFVAMSRSDDDAIRRQGVQGFMGLVVESEDPLKLIDSQRIEIADALVARFDDPEQRIRTMAISLLGQTRPPSEIYVPKLIELLKHETTRFAALLAIGYYGPSASSAVPVLIGLLKSGDGRTMQQTCFALRDLGAAASDAVPELIKLLDSSERTIRTGAAGALGAIGPAAADALPKLDALVAEQAQGASTFKHAAELIRGNPSPK